MSYISRDRTGAVRKGERVDELLDKIEDLQNVTHETDGTMSTVDKIKLDELEYDQELTVDEIAALINF